MTELLCRHCRADADEDGYCPTCGKVTRPDDEPHAAASVYDDEED